MIRCIFTAILSILTVCLVRADLAAPPRLEHWIGAVGLGALGLDVAAADAADDAALLVDLKIFDGVCNIYS